MSERRVEQEVLVERPVPEVFRAWASAPALAAWFAPMAVRPAVVDMRFELGGHYRIEMDVGPGGIHVTEGRYLEIDPDRRIRMTWRCDAWDDPPSVVDVTFTARGSATLVRVEHTAITTEPAEEGQRFGWSACLAELKSSLMESDGRGDR